ncbi:hypothetical protein GOODEAATRI_001288 [Goodea atripinnis]|uniref:Farnesyl pyrophosphate synthase n=1 Tax=Goodea atripinnis TaxID=208336 RepID=A0ABV0NQW3_9TELE
MDGSVTRRGQLCWYKKDDYLDCYGDPVVTGKIGTDIQDNKCSWLVVKALEVMSTKQRTELEACYGRKDEDSVAKVKELYNTLQMPTLYHKYEEESYQRLQKLIAQHAQNLPHSGDAVCNGTHSKKLLLSDPEAFDAKFEELVTELTDGNLQDPGLAYALNRLRELQAFFLMADDIMDASVTRRGQPCWYKRVRPPDQPYYVHLLELFNEVSPCSWKGVVINMGYDDFLDCYGDPAVTGKIGTDIQDNKCSWLVVKALEVMTPEQKSVLEACYGRKDESSVAKVKELYNALQMPTLYHTYEEESYQRLQKLIAQHAQSLPHSVFLNFAKKIYKRNK